MSCFGILAFRTDIKIDNKVNNTSVTVKVKWAYTTLINIYIYIYIYIYSIRANFL